MKGLAFTLDALFALIIAIAGISILLYFQFYPETPFILKSTEAQLILGALYSTNLTSLTSSSAIISSMVSQSNAAGQAWPQFGGQPTRAGSQPTGPSKPFVSEIITVNSLISTPIAAANGNIYFSAGSTMYAYNASGYLVWKNTTASSIKTGPAVYNQEVIYWNSPNVIALSTYNGSLLWSNNALSATSPSGQPLVYDGILYLISHNENIFAFGVYNGVLLGTTNIGYPGSYAKAISIASGSPIFSYFSVNEVLLLTNTFPGAQQEIWANTLSSPPTNLAAYANVMALGVGTSADIYGINGTLLTSYNTGTQTSGVAVSQSGNIIYQSSGGLTDITPQGTVLWAKPSLSLTYGAAMSGAIPVIGGGNVYTLWSNNYLTAENLSTGSVVWATQIPYANLNPNMTVAYGRLWVIAGDNIISYGSCNTNARTNVFQAASSLYVNGQGSCADYLLNSIEPLSNYSIASGQTYLAGQNIAGFNGQNSLFTTGSNYSSLSTMTISFWAYPEGSSSGNQVFIDSNPEGTWRVGFTSSNTFFFDPGVQSTKTSSAKVAYNKWQFVTLTAEDSYANTIYTLYINGVKQTTGTISNKNIVTIHNLTFSYNAFPYNGLLANVQLYDTVLNNQQIGVLYQSGAQSGPISGAGILSWWPLDGDGNDYGGQFNTAYPANINYINANYVPSGLLNAFEIGRTGTTVPILNYSTGNTVLYNLGVDAWK